MPMAGRDELRKSVKWCSFFASVAILTLAGVSATATAEEELRASSESSENQLQLHTDSDVTETVKDEATASTSAADDSASSTVSVPVNKANDENVNSTDPTDDRVQRQHVHRQGGKYSQIEPDTERTELAEDEVLIVEEFVEVNEDESDDTAHDEESEWQKTCKRADRKTIDQSLQRPMILISSMDGQVTAFDAEDGTVKWSVTTGDLLSSSISKIEMSRKGIPTHLIPSLDGGLYQFDGKSIEPVPFGADILLSSSFRFNDDTMVVGGKETENYGIDAQNGEVRYICSMDGCMYISEGPDPQTAILREDDDDEVLVISRHTKTIRSIEMRTGSEKWNFSVGQHELSFISQSNTQPPSIGQGDEEEECKIDEENLWIEDEVNEEDGDDVGKEGSTLPVKIRVIVPQGVVLAVKKDDPEAIIWQHKLPAAIADAWTLHENTLRPLSLFSAEHNFALSSSDEDEASDDVPASPLLYVGMHNEQLYVQPSIQMRSNVERATSQILTSGSTNVRMPRVRWLPYLATASSRTPAVIAQKNPLLITYERDEIEKLNGEERNLALRQRQYPYDNGYYLFSEKTPMLLPNASTPGSEESYEDITVSLMNWWREVLAISVVSSILVHLLLVMLCKSFNKKPACESTNSAEPENAPVDQISATEIKSDSEPTKQYNSRYQTDFKQVACLGKGGFGVVFQAKNNMDDCDYAVKRIALNNSDRAKQKVMREVKALAKLDHVGIVRYNQAWFECPPPGWQEEQDNNNTDLQDLETSQASASVTTFTPTASEKMAPAQEKEIAKSINNINPLRPFGTEFSQQLTDISESAEPEKIGSSEGFEPSLVECSSSISSGVGFIRSDIPDDSFEICFGDESCQNEPFKAYSEISESVDIIFEAESNTEAKSSSKPTPTPSVRPQTLRLSSRASSGLPNISAPRIYLYIQMQMCQRESLKDWLCNNTLSRDRMQCLSFFHQILCAVDYVHQCGLMHRDLKPSNIFFSMDGAIKVGDFGLVTALEENCEITPDERSHSRMKSRRHTDQVGTELYMSPEQSLRHPYTQKVDIYALGLIFFELFFPFGTQMERIQTLVDVKKLSFPKRFERELRKEYEFVQPMLSHNSEQRPSTIDLLQSKFLLNFEENHLQRVRSASRSRTVSTSSSGSDILKSA